MEIRELKISANASGGTAAAGAKTYRITLPSSWVKKMDLDHADAKAEVVFDGTSIIIRPKAAEDILLFQSQALKAGHQVVRYEYFDKETLCSTILCDFTEKILRVINHTDRILKTAFGRQESGEVLLQCAVFFLIRSVVLNCYRKGKQRCIRFLDVRIQCFDDFIHCCRFVHIAAIALRRKVEGIL